MELVRYMPRNSLANFNAPLSRFFDDFFTPFVATGETESVGRMLPTVDIYEKENKIRIDAEIPGVAKEDIHVDVKGRRLTLSGESKTVNEVKDDNNYRRERRYGRFERTFNLAFDIDPEKVEAKYENGVLSLVIPRPEELQAKQVTIQ
jgi:HSP20 family protein